MALDQKLRSDITGDAVPHEAEQSVLENALARTFSDTGESAEERTIDGKEFSSKVAQVSNDETITFSDIKELLQSVCQQLERLNRNVNALEQREDLDKTLDFRTIVSKNDSIQLSIENLLNREATECSAYRDVLIKIEKLDKLIEIISSKQDRNDRQLSQTLRENANFQIQVRQGMQHDLDLLKKQQSGEQFNPLLKEIALMYVEYHNLLEDDTISDTSRSNLYSLFDQLEDLLSDYGAEICHSGIGDVRRARQTKIVSRISTGDKDKHNTIAVSRKPGVIRGRTVLWPESVDVFVFDPDSVEVATEDGSCHVEDLNDNASGKLAEDPDTKVLVEEQENVDFEVDAENGKNEEHSF